MKCAVAALSALLVVWLSSCTGEPQSAGVGEPAASDRAMSPTTTIASITPSPAVQSVGFDETYRVNGLAVRISEVREEKLGPVPATSDGSGKEGDRYQILTAQVTNRSSTTVELIMTPDLTYGSKPQEAAQVELGSWRDPTLLEPGETTEYPFGYIIPAAHMDEVTLKVTITLEPLRTAVFSGPLRPKSH